MTMPYFSKIIVLELFSIPSEQRQIPVREYISMLSEMICEILSAPSQMISL
jgi:hypothetical protein